MKQVYLSYNNIISPLGFDSKTVVENVLKEKSGISEVSNPKLSPASFHASLISSEKLSEAFAALNLSSDYTRLEKMLLLSLHKVISKAGISLDDKVGLIVSTTKGNIDVLERASRFAEKRAYLSELGKLIKNHFGFKNEAIVLSNACVSGVLAVAIAKKQIQSGLFDHVFIVSGDIISAFVVSGFNSFQALSDAPCKPYSENRKGISLGEAAVSVLVTSNPEGLAPEAVAILGEASCNDANHISGPSRTGEGLFRSVKGALREASIQPEMIDYISAHGTATLFNDEMEAIAFNRLHMANIPLNSLKGYFGHTLGASGLLETVIGMYSAHENTLFTSLGFDKLGVSKPLAVIEEVAAKPIKTFLKTASGFGGCNTAVIFQKVNL
ncbi:3-oxoacyl-[acyl-carrier-protein] synthase-1 [Ulvibacter sp. MAR_2010_11]|uniref:beta-ketoacyl-[acyl-carrier-protein] synthase family protein n=1 Tax=Ulvibacter sp. MAR_2010_11 TaxID=1250229 RepID=UPI000C2C1A31|nr:beta-ketoacyl synthase N-terminal-like domain-containing protein [Ulvibacter sp. MAR_2010_11]PKA83223.1 3-oxoacyl-[acyl-carrier-protein] synthase-1 [Ulvibacter sp. MAR_2010_11]